MKKILMLTANPNNTARLRLEEEVREIEHALERAKHRDQFEIISKFAVRVDDLRRALLDHEPQIVHFSGHGAGSDGLALEDNSGQMKLVSTASLARLFNSFKDEVECVFLNACYSEVQAEAIHQHIGYVVGMKQAIGDCAAIEFAKGFYDALAAGRTIEEAFEIGCTSIDLERIPESLTPVLKFRKQVVAIPIDQASVQQESTSQTNLAQSSERNTSTSSGAFMSADSFKETPLNQTQSFGNITFSGNNNTLAANQAKGNINVSQNMLYSSSTNDIQEIFTILETLKKDIATTDTLNLVEKESVKVPIHLLEAELQKPEPDKSLIDQAIAALKKGLDGVVTLAEPVMKVASLIAKLWMV